MNNLKFDMDNDLRQRRQLFNLIPTQEPPLPNPATSPVKKKMSPLLDDDKYHKFADHSLRQYDFWDSVVVKLFVSRI
jgi:hypothetical protein